MKIVFGLIFLIQYLNSVNSSSFNDKDPTDYEEIEQRDIIGLYRRNLEAMLNHLDASVDPCDNFFEHVCNGYRKGDDKNGIYWLRGNATDADEEENIPPPFLYNREDRLHFFEEQRFNFGTQQGKILNQLFESCNSRNSFNVINGPPLPRWTRMLREIEFLHRKEKVYKNWPFVQFQWDFLSRRHYNLNWIVLAARFAAHGLPSPIGIFFAKNTIYIAPGIEALDCPSLEEIELSLLPLLGDRHPQIASLIGNELWTFCKLLTEDENVKEEAELKAKGEEDTPTNSTEHLESIYFNTFFMTLNLTEAEVEEARHIPVDLPRLRRLLNLLQDYNPRIVFNFVMWQAYMALEYEDCFQLTREFEDFLLAEYWNWNVFEEFFKRDVAIGSFLFHTMRFQRHRKTILMSADWDKFLFRKLQRKDYNFERMLRDYGGNELSFDLFLKFYADVRFTENHFYANLLALRRAKLRSSFYRPLIDEEDVNHPLYFMREFLKFAILLIKQPLFHYFATQGFEMWQSSNLLYSSDGFYTALDCLERQSVNHLPDEDESEGDPNLYKILPESEIQEIYNFHSTFYESLKDYRFWLSAESFPFAEEFVLEYFGMDPQRILFYAVTQLYCSRNDALYSSLINRSFMNLPDFAAAFNCSEESPMNPIAKCMARN